MTQTGGWGHQGWLPQGSDIHQRPKGYWPGRAGKETIPGKWNSTCKKSTDERAWGILELGGPVELGCAQGSGVGTLPGRPQMTQCPAGH